MAKEIICPRKFHPDGDGLCIKEKCAWWHPLNIQTKKGRCSILSIAIANHWMSVNPNHHKIEVKS